MALLVIAVGFVLLQLSATLAMGGRGSVAPVQDGVSEPTAFTHAKHVPDAWLDLDEPERLRDCRGCHDYSLDSPHDPQAICTNCHFSDEDNRYVFSLEASLDAFATGLEALRTPGSLFQHSNHDALECRECHQVEGDSIAAPILMPRKGGEALCLECHGGSKPRQQTLRFMSVLRNGDPVTADRRATAVAKLERGLVQSLNGSPEMGPNQGATMYVEPFRHQDHILAEFLGQGTPLAELKGAGQDAQRAREAQCTVCHGPMFGAVAGFKTAPGDPVHQAFEQAPETCGACHIANEQQDSITFSFAQGMKPSLTAGTFSHADHLGFERSAGGAAKASALGYDRIESKGCEACHTYDPSSVSGFTLSASFTTGDGFAGCAECHTQAAWVPADLGDWSAHQNHGDWSTCSQCHEFGSEDFANSRSLASVRRIRPGTFRIESQAHPHITVEEGETVEETCAKCHRQPIKSLPSRIQEAAFNHATHLPENPTTADCVLCHGATITGAEQSSDIGARVLATSGDLELAAVDARGRVYDPSACATCHLGTPPKPSSGPTEYATVQPRSVPEFSHAAHIGKTLAGGREVACSDCHAPPSDPLAAGSSMGIIEGALNCTQCHDHSGSSDSLRAPSTGGGVTSQEVTSCVLCHVTGIPELDAEVQIPFTHIADISGGDSQFHPLDQECTTCHIPREGLIVASQVAETHSRVFAQRTHYSPAESVMSKPAIHRGDTRKLREDRVTCFACHWTNTLVDAADGGTAIPNPETTAARAAVGDSLDGQFPGGNPKHFK